MFVGLATAAAIAAFALSDDQIVAWSLLGPTMGAFWIWALSPRFAAFWVYLLGFTTPLVLNIVESGSEISMMISVVTVAVFATYSPLRAVVRLSLVSFIFVMCTLGIVQAINDFAWPIWLLGTCFAWVVGEGLWQLSHTVNELEHTRSLVADQATLQERRRIARDVHDLVGHSLTVVLLHVTGARHLVHTDPDEAERALEQAEEAGRQSLAEIRRTVGLLRDETDPGAPIVPSSNLGDVHELVSEFVAAGLDARHEQSGQTDHVDPTTSLAGYRIIQEALTNASRHTVGADVVVSVVVGDDSCDIRVTNTGGETIDLGRGSGFGLVSMRERAKSVGGSLVAGPTPGGWMVDASLPIAPAEPWSSGSQQSAATEAPHLTQAGVGAAVTTPTSQIGQEVAGAWNAAWQSSEEFLRSILPAGCFPNQDHQAPPQ